MGTDPPIIDKFDINATPVMTIAVSGQRAMPEITEIARKQIKEDLESAPRRGRGDPGGRPAAGDQRLSSTPTSCTSDNLSIEDVRQALIRRTWSCPAAASTRAAANRCCGRWAASKRSADFRELIVANHNGYPVRIKDIGRVEDSFEEPRG